MRLRQTRSRPDYRIQSLGFDSVSKAVVLHQSLASSAFGEQCVSFWWDAYLPKTASSTSRRVFPTSASRKPWCNSWAETITRMSTNSSVLRKALYALSLSCAGCQRGDEHLAQEGLKYYGEALAQLAQILQNPNSAVKDEFLLPTCLQLADYEVRSFLFSFFSREYLVKS